MRSGIAAILVCLAGIGSAAARSDDVIRLTCSKSPGGETTHFALNVIKRTWSGGPENRQGEPLRIDQNDFVLSLHDGVNAFAVVYRANLMVNYNGWYQCQREGTAPSTTRDRRVLANEKERQQ